MSTRQKWYIRTKFSAYRLQLVSSAEPVRIMMSKECKRFMRSNCIYTVPSTDSEEESIDNYQFDSEDESLYRYSEDEGDLEVGQDNETVGASPPEIQTEPNLSKTPSDLDVSQLMDEDAKTNAPLSNATASAFKPIKPDRQPILDNSRKNYIKPDLRPSPEEKYMQQKLHKDEYIGAFKSTILVHNLFSEFEQLKWCYNPDLDLSKQADALKVVDQDQLDRTILKYVWKSADWTKTEQIPDVQPAEGDLIMSFTERMASFEYNLLSKILLQMAFPNCYKGVDCYQKPLSAKDTLNKNQDRNDPDYDWLQDLCYKKPEAIRSQDWYDPDSYWLQDKQVTIDKIEKLVSWHSNPNTLQTKIYYTETELRRVQSLLIYFRRTHDRYTQCMNELKDKNEPCSWTKDQKEWVKPITAAVTEKSREEMTDIEIVKAAKLFKAIKEVLLQKQYMLIKLQVVLQKLMDKLEIQHNQLNIAHDLKTAVNQDAKQVAEAKDLSWHKQLNADGPPEIIRFYRWSNLKHMTRQFDCAEFYPSETFFQQGKIAKGDVEHIKKVPLLQFPTVKQLHATDKPSDALFVKLSDLKAMMSNIGYIMDKTIEDKAKEESKNFVSDLRTATPAGTRLYPLPASTDLRVLCATIDFEKQLDPEVQIAPINFHRGFEIVHTSDVKNEHEEEDYKGHTFKMSIDESFLLQSNASLKTNDYETASLYLDEVKEIINSTPKGGRWARGSTTMDKRLSAKGISPLASTIQQDAKRILPAASNESFFPQRFKVSSSHSSMNEHLWKTVHSGAFFTKKASQAELTSLSEAFVSLCKFLWHLNQMPGLGKVTAEKRHTAYNYPNFNKMLSVMEYSVENHHIFSDRIMALKNGGSLICAHCQQSERLAHAVINNHQETFIKYVRQMQRLTVMNLRHEHYIKSLTKRSRTSSKRALSVESKMAEMNQKMTDLKLSLDLLYGEKVELIEEVSNLIAEIIEFNDGQRQRRKINIMNPIMAETKVLLDPYESESIACVAGVARRILKQRFPTEPTHELDYLDSSSEQAIDDAHSCEQRFDEVTCEDVSRMEELD